MTTERDNTIWYAYYHFGDGEPATWALGKDPESALDTLLNGFDALVSSDLGELALGEESPVWDNPEKVVVYGYDLDTAYGLANRVIGSDLAEPEQYRGDDPRFDHIWERYLRYAPKPE